MAKYPNLIRLGAHRRATQQGHSSATDGRPYNHSYTEEDAKGRVGEEDAQTYV